jgi:hypothetical protein
MILKVFRLLIGFCYDHRLLYPVGHQINRLNTRLNLSYAEEFSFRKATERYGSGSQRGLNRITTKQTRPLP